MILKKLVKVHNFRVSYVLFSTAVAYKEKKIDVGKYSINYLKVGNGPHSVLAMPGALGSVWTDFGQQVEGFDKEKFNLVVWDPPGYGKTRPPEREFGLDFLERDADTAYQLMKALNIPKFSLMGWSNGGISSVILSAKYSHAVQNLILISVSATILPRERDIFLSIKDVRKWSAKSRKPMEELYGEEGFANLWAQWTDTMMAINLKNNGNVCANYLKNIMCPTFLFYGEKDPLVDVNFHVSQMRKHIKNTRIHVYPEGKHNVHKRYAEDFNKNVQQFLLEERAERKQL